MSSSIYGHSAPVPEAVAFALLTVRLLTREYIIQGHFLEDVQRKSFQKYITDSMTILVVLSAITHEFMKRNPLPKLLLNP